MKSFLLFIFLASDLSALQSSFIEGEKLSESRKNGLADQIKSGAWKSAVPQFQEEYSISQDETASAFQHAKESEAGKAIMEIHKTRGMYKFEETDPLISKSENLHKDPQKSMNEIEVSDIGSTDYTIEYCEECSDAEHLVTARKTKKRYVYLQTPPYITAGQGCQNHGYLTIKVEIVSEPEEIFREDGEFKDITHLSTVPWGGAYIDETYRVNGVNVVLRKTIQQNGSPWIHPGCYLVPDLQNHVVSAATMITKLLGGASDEYLPWGQVGNAYLHHRVVNDTGEHYWILDDKCQEYEELTRQGLCRYHSMIEDPPTDKYWKGKKVNDSWGQTVTYACKYSCKSTCACLKQRGCEQIGSECIESIGNHCVKWKQKFQCKGKINPARTKLTGNTAFCLDGNCLDSGFQSDQDMIQALGYLSLLEAIRKELPGTEDIQVFKGHPYSCTRWCLSFKDCCNCGGWGVSIGLTSCDEDSKTVGKLRQEGKCVLVGTFTAEREKFTKMPIRKKTVFCCFGNKFAKLLQEQGKPQLGQNFGTPEEPNCRGFTAEELSKIDFSKLDLTEIISDVMSTFKPKNTKDHFASGGELEKIQESMKELPMMKNAGTREGSYLNENMKHLISSSRVRAAPAED